MEAAAVAVEDDNDVVVISASSQSPPPSQEEKRTAAENKKKNKNPETAAANKKKKKMNKDEDGADDDGKQEEEEEDAFLCRFPMGRVWRLVRGEGGNTDIRSSREAAFLINKASSQEIFLHRFAEDAFANAVKERRNSISYNHLSSVVSNGKHYEFLSDFVPQKVKAENALKAGALVET